MIGFENFFILTPSRFRTDINLILQTAGQLQSRQLQRSLGEVFQNENDGKKFYSCRLKMCSNEKKSNRLISDSAKPLLFNKGMQEQEKSKLIIVLQGFFMVAVTVSPFIEGYRPPPAQNAFDYIMSFFLLAGLALTFYSTYTLRKAFTIQTSIKKDTELVISFPFNFSRNPMYLGGLISCYAWAGLQHSISALVMTLALNTVLVFKVKIEEKNLEKIFGEKYTNYQKSTGRFF